jgi:hypothetical protein
MGSRDVVLVLIALGLFSGCAPSALIRPDDPLFRDGEARLAQAVERTPPAPPAERALFLQAESFFHARSELSRPRGSFGYALEIAAAATDFAPLSSAAASENLLQIRLQAYNGAAQLYERFLSEYPQSTLRPLALYRLGWTYRNTTAEGFPRTSEQAFAALQPGDSRLVPAALVADARATPWKSLDAAEAWSLIPGGGQLYVGETLNGSVRLGIGLGFAALALVPAIHLIREQKFSWLPAVLSAIGIVGLEVSYSTGFEDAQRAVVQFNEAHEHAFELAHPDAPP